MRAAIVALAALARSAGGEAPTPAPTPAPPTAPPTAPAPTTLYRPSASPTEEFCAPRRIRDRMETCDDAARYGADCHALEVHLGVNCGDCACVADTTGLGTGWTFGAYVDDACEDPLRHWDGDVVVADLPSGARTYANDACAAATWSGTAISFRGRCASGSVYFRMFEGEGCNASRPYDDRDRVWLAASPFPLSDGSFCAPVEHVGSAWDNPREYLLFSCFDTPVPTAAPTFAPTHSLPPTEAPTVSPTVSPARDRRPFGRENSKHRHCHRRRRRILPWRPRRSRACYPRQNRRRCPAKRRRPRRRSRRSRRAARFPRRRPCPPAVPRRVPLASRRPSRRARRRYRRIRRPTHRRRHPRTLRRRRRGRRPPRRRIRPLRRR